MILTDLSMRDTIAAPATAPGQAGIGIIRLSGSRAEEILNALFTPLKEERPLKDRYLYLGTLRDGEQVIDRCMAVLMRGPHSYTREDVAELQLHGSPLVMRRALDAVLARGARPAEPGEFTMRAFLNGRIDLSQAESVMQLIRASSDRAAKSALSQLDGGTEAFVTGLSERVTALLARLEAAIDYPEEIDEEVTAAQLAEGCRALHDEMLSAVNERALNIRENGLPVALCGAPNAGKSTLLNALLMEEKAIVTPVPGTTRDIVEGELQLDGYLVRLRDTAGLRQTDDQAETIGVSRALAAAGQADLVLWLMDGTDPSAEPPPPGFPPAVILYTKADLTGAVPVPEGALRISARTGEGMQALKERMLSAIRAAGETPLTARRHMALCREAAASLREAEQAFSGGAPLEFGAVCLHEAAERLAQITGARADEALLDSIFSQFCVGK